MPMGLTELDHLPFNISFLFYDIENNNELGIVFCPCNLVERLRYTCHGAMLVDERR